MIVSLSIISTCFYKWAAKDDEMSALSEPGLG